jgi:hypothetical protein
VAAGGDKRLGTRAGVGGDGGIFGDSRSLLIMASANGLVYLLAPESRRRRAVFVTSGYSLLGIGYGEGSFSAWNVGIGANLWSSEHAGFRAEFRDNVRPDPRGTVHYWTVRGGLAFR